MRESTKEKEIASFLIGEDIFSTKPWLILKIKIQKVL